jgi:hypothetical protein
VRLNFVKKFSTSVSYTDAYICATVVIIKDRHLVCTIICLNHMLIVKFLVTSFIPIAVAVDVETKSSTASKTMEPPLALL